MLELDAGYKPEVIWTQYRGASNGMAFLNLTKDYVLQFNRVHACVIRKRKKQALLSNVIFLGRRTHFR